MHFTKYAVHNCYFWGGGVTSGSFTAERYSPRHSPLCTSTSVVTLDHVLLLCGISLTGRYRVTGKVRAYLKPQTLSEKALQH
jgi:hypothetical protein